jgi:HSP20 family protein
MVNTLVKRKPEESPRALMNIQDQINQLFDMAFGRSPATAEEMALPAVDLSEDKDNVYVDADIPGMEQKDINVSMKDDYLVISGNKEEVREEKKKNYYRSERLQGSFYRQVMIPASVDAAKVKAMYKNGVLKVTLPKKEEAKGKEIKVNVE